jgi:hypothetical protein
MPVEFLECRADSLGIGVAELIEDVERRLPRRPGGIRIASRPVRSYLFGDFFNDPVIPCAVGTGQISWRRSRVSSGQAPVAMRPLWIIGCRA